MAIDADGRGSPWSTPKATRTLTLIVDRLRDGRWETVVSTTLESDAPPTIDWLSEPESRRPRACRRALVACVVAAAAGQGQAGAGACAAKIETCASSGSMTPKIFWSVRRWTQLDQLSK